MALNKQDLNAIEKVLNRGLDAKLGQYQKAVVGAVDFKLGNVQTSINKRFDELKSEVGGLREQIQQLTKL